VRWTERRNHEEFIRLLENRSVNVKELISHRTDIGEATHAYDMILKGRERYVGVIIRYPSENRGETIVRIGKTPAAPSAAHDRVCVGLIGAGMFTRNVFLPVLAKTPGIRLAGVAASTGVNAQHIGRRFGFEFITTEYSKILSDKRIGSVFITTRHDLHAEMVCNSLKAGKNVFVEKPLAISSEELNRMVKAYRSSSRPVVMVGFNRRYSPLSREISAFLEGRTSPLQALIRVNASYIPPDHWTQDPTVGGGRIIGEVCHFVDYLQFLTHADPVAVTASCIDGSTGKYLRDDNVSLSVQFSDGSLGTILYTAMGSKAYSRERVEVYSEESVAILDDFRSVEFVRGAHRTTKRLRSQDYGYRNEIDAFLEMDTRDSAALFRQAVLTTRTTLAALDSLRTKKRIVISAGDLTE
jgi:predicted dehydrogenase